MGRNLQTGSRQGKRGFAAQYRVGFRRVSPGTVVQNQPRQKTQTPRPNPCWPGQDAPRPARPTLGQSGRALTPVTGSAARASSRRSARRMAVKHAAGNCAFQPGLQPVAQAALIHQGPRAGGIGRGLAFAVKRRVDQHAIEFALEFRRQREDIGGRQNAPAPSCHWRRHCRWPAAPARDRSRAGDRQCLAPAPPGKGWPCPAPAPNSSALHRPRGTAAASITASSPARKPVSGWRTMTRPSRKFLIPS